MKRPSPNIPLNMTQARRRLVSDLLPNLADRLKTGDAASRTIRFSAKELQQVVTKCKAATRKATKRKVWGALLQVALAASEALEGHKQGEIGRSSAVERVYQFKITLKGIRPSIWRRIQTKDCTLDKLHEHVQTAMGWTNSHLHQFEIGGVIYGDPELLYEGWQDETPPLNSLRIKISKIVPADGKRFRFDYEYDFGDGWEHEVLFEGCLRAEKNARYPLCLEGERACPPEDVGGIHGYQVFSQAIADPKHKEHKSYLQWGGPFDPEAFDAGAASKAMRKGLPNWREEE